MHYYNRYKDSCIQKCKGVLFADFTMDIYNDEEGTNWEYNHDIEDWDSDAIKSSSDSAYDRNYIIDNFITYETLKHIANELFEKVSGDNKVRIMGTFFFDMTKEPDTEDEVSVTDFTYDYDVIGPITPTLITPIANKYDKSQEFDAKSNSESFDTKETTDEYSIT